MGGLTIEQANQVDQALRDLREVDRDARRADAQYQAAVLESGRRRVLERLLSE